MQNELSSSGSTVTLSQTTCSHSDCGPVLGSKNFTCYVTQKPRQILLSLSHLTPLTPTTWQETSADIHSRPCPNCSQRNTHLVHPFPNIDMLIQHLTVLRCTTGFCKPVLLQPDLSADLLTYRQTCQSLSQVRVTCDQHFQQSQHFLVRPKCIPLSNPSDPLVRFSVS